MQFTWQDINWVDAKKIHQGGWGNAVVSCIHVGGSKWVIKTFKDALWVYKHTFGRFWIWREYQALTLLKGLAGIPRDAFLLDDWSLCCRYEEGRTLMDIRKRPVPVDQSFFIKLEQTVQNMHMRGIAHLDLRNGRNIIMRSDGVPVLIDFPTYINLKKFPSGLRKIFQDIDISGVYKWWNRLSPDTMNQARFDILQGFSRKRRLWPFKGYGSWLRLWRPSSRSPQGS